MNLRIIDSLVWGFEIIGMILKYVFSMVCWDLLICICLCI